jgi:integrase
MQLHLTDRFCQHAKAGAIQTDYFDDQITGLALRITKGGTKSWTLTYGTPRRRITLGRYPAISLAAARTAAIEVREGHQTGTVAALAEVYLRNGNGKRSAPQIERRLRKDVLPIIGHIPLPELHRRDVTRVIDAKLVSAPITARRVFEDIRAMVRFAVSRGDLDHNPMDGMKGPPISKPRTRVLSDDEIRALWDSLPKISENVGRVVKLCLVTGQRVGEVCRITTSELDLRKAVWNIPASRTKNGHPHQVPLSPMAIKLIGEGLTGLTRSHVTKSICDAQAKLQIAQFTPHDLRRTALTKMAELGIPPIVLGHIANHRTTTKASITLGVYVQYQYENEKRKALELWAKRLEGIVSGGAATVVNIRRSR